MIEIMGQFTAIGMRTPVPDKTALVINTCAHNDGITWGDAAHWAWANPTNRALTASCFGYYATCVETLWQGLKMFKDMTEPDPEVLKGAWRRHKKQRPLGHWQGHGKPLITTPGEARRLIYLPAYIRQCNWWLYQSPEKHLVQNAVRAAFHHASTRGPVFLRDHNEGRGVDENRPMSHAWVLACWLNGNWPL